MSLYIISIPCPGSMLTAFAAIPWLQILQALLTPVIGITTIYIAWQQWQANKFKLVLDRYERRLRIYEEVISIFYRVQQDFKPEISDMQKFRTATAEADFLFEPEIPKYLDEILQRGLKLHFAHKKYRDFTQPLPPGYDHEAVVKEIYDQETWFTAQFDPAKEKFRKYLDISR